MTMATIRATARRYGKPEPIFSETIVKPLPGGGFVSVEGSERPLRPEWGGGPQPERPIVHDTLELRAKVAEHIARMREAGIEVEWVEEPVADAQGAHPAHKAVARRRKRA